jgi:uncharacterized lipoprotein YbaY
MGQVRVTGRVLFGPDATSFGKATAYVSLLDVSRQDAPSRAVAKQVIKGVQKGKELKFSLKGTIDDPTGMYVVSVLIDVDGDGEVSVGDYITTGYYQVAAEGDSKVDVRVQKVT